jgi:hypothetical protein
MKCGAVVQFISRKLKCHIKLIIILIFLIFLLQTSYWLSAAAFQKVIITTMIIIYLFVIILLFILLWKTHGGVTHTFHMGLLTKIKFLCPVSLTKNVTKTNTKIQINNGYPK